MFRKPRIAIILVTVLVLAATLAGAAFAATRDAGENSLYKSFISKLADNLGVGEDKVTEALTATKNQMLDEAVQNGTITREQADRMAEQKIEDFCGFGRFRGWHGMGGPMGEPMGGPRGGMRFMGKDPEDVLGITPKELKAEIDAGKTWEQILSDHGYTAEQFKARMMERHKENLEKAVEEGRITREQADKMLEGMSRGESKMNFRMPNNEH